MDRLMRLAEALRDIAKNGAEEELLQAFDLCWSFADRIGHERPGAVAAIDERMPVQSVHGPN